MNGDLIALGGHVHGPSVAPGRRAVPGVRIAGAVVVRTGAAVRVRAAGVRVAVRWPGSAGPRGPSARPTEPGRDPPHRPVAVMTIKVPRSPAAQVRPAPAAERRHSPVPDESEVSGKVAARRKR